MGGDLGVLPPLLVDKLLDLLHFGAILELLPAYLAEDIGQVGLLERLSGPANGLIREAEILINKVLKEYLVGLHGGFDAGLDLRGELVGPITVLDPVREVSQDVIEGLEVLGIFVQTALFLEIRPFHQRIQTFLVLAEHSHRCFERAHDCRKVGHPHL